MYSIRAQRGEVQTFAVSKCKRPNAKVEPVRVMVVGLVRVIDDSEGERQRYAKAR